MFSLKVGLFATHATQFDLDLEASSGSYNGRPIDKPGRAPVRGREAEVEGKNALAKLSAFYGNPSKNSHSLQTT